MIIYEVDSVLVTERSGKTEAGREWKSREQKAYANLFDPATGQLKRYPAETKLRLQEGQQPYALGFYVMSPASVYLDRYDAPACDVQLVTYDEYMAMTAPAFAKLFPKPQAQHLAQAQQKAV